MINICIHLSDRLIGFIHIVVTWQKKIGDKREKIKDMTRPSLSLDR